MTINVKAKIAIIGVGAMGNQHARDIYESEKTELVAVCDANRPRADKYADRFGVPAYYDHIEMMEKVEMDGVLIAVPQFDHPSIAEDAFNRGVHVLVEKPIAAHVLDAQKMINAYEEACTKYPNLLFAIMFQQRTYGFWKKVKSLIDEGELGNLVRTTWIITDWFRTQIYYDNGGWRATWKGDGGGVLLNQCPHNLDLFQWFVGMPKRITGFASIGKYHTVEVEDEVTAYLEHENGMISHFITSTGESPGTNRLEIVGENGKLVFENDQLTFYRNRYSMFKQLQTAVGGFDTVENWEIKIPYQHHGQPGHKLIIENFAHAINMGEALIAPAIEGIHSLIIGNAIMMSSFLGQPIDLPMDAEAYAARLQDLIDNSRFQKQVREIENVDLSNSF